MNEHINPTIAAVLDAYAAHGPEPRDTYRVTALRVTGMDMVSMGDTLAQVAACEEWRARDLWQQWRTTFAIVADTDGERMPALDCPEGWHPMAAWAAVQGGAWCGIALWRQDRGGE